MYNKILNEYIKYLHIMFDLLNKKNITFLFKKSYFNYFTITFLNQHVDIFNLTIIIDKIAIILTFNFSYKLIDLKFYFDFID